MTDQNKIILPLDGFTDFKDIYDLLTKVHSEIWGVKLNDFLDLEGVSIIKKLKKMFPDIHVFADPKLHDIPNTVVNRLKHYRKVETDILTVHISGGVDMLRLAKENAFKMKIIGVTILTSLSNIDTSTIYFASVKEKIRQFFDIALYSGLDGIVCSPQDLKYLYEHVTEEEYCRMIKICPAIRPEWYGVTDDQKRKATPKEAIRNGADLLVIGRPILLSDDPLEAIQRTNEEINNAWRD